MTRALRETGLSSAELQLVTEDLTAVGIIPTTEAWAALEETLITTTGMSREAAQAFIAQTQATIEGEAAARTAEEAARALTEAQDGVAGALHEVGLEGEYLEQALGLLEDEGIVPMIDQWDLLEEAVVHWGAVTGNEIDDVIGQFAALRRAQAAANAFASSPAGRQTGVHERRATGTRASGATPTRRRYQQ